MKKNNNGPYAVRRALGSVLARPGAAAGKGT
jgi:hypothetical protein